MNASIAAPQSDAASSGSRPRHLGRYKVLPTYCLVLMFGALCIPIGVLWDISWHSTIGRDTFWTPAHILTYLGGLIPGLTCGWLALKTHFFGSPEERAPSVSFWGFRAPLGAWVVIWGTFTMLLSAPFDNWWHNAYGLDVKILSPPHTVLAVGMLAVALGVLFLMVSWQNRTGQESPVAAYLFVFMAGILLLMASIFLTERSTPNQQLTAGVYFLSARPYPVYLVAAARASRLRWPATIVASVYMLLLMAMIWILPLFEGHPKLAPIYNPVDHMVPPAFPLLLIAPAIAIDLIVQWSRRKRIIAAESDAARPWWRSQFVRDFGLAALIGVAFMAVFIPVQWNFSKFLISRSADNWFFAGGQFFPYTSGSHGMAWRNQYWDLDENPFTLRAALIATSLAILFSRIGLGFGNWMAKVRR